MAARNQRPFDHTLNGDLTQPTWLGMLFSLLFLPGHYRQLSLITVPNLGGRDTYASPGAPALTERSDLFVVPSAQEKRPCTLRQFAVVKPNIYGMSRNTKELGYLALGDQSRCF